MTAFDIILATIYVVCLPPVVVELTVRAFVRAWLGERANYIKSQYKEAKED